MAAADLKQDDGMFRMGTESNDALRIVNLMRDSGLQADLDMPRLVFCGNQSAAKSTLVEVIFGVPLPRGDGTCTRSVTEVRSRNTPDKPFHASVSLRWEYDDVKASEREITITEPVGECNQRGEITNLCEFGQMVLLNPGHHFDAKTKDADLVYMKDVDYELKFTRNVVCVNVEGPDEGNLSGIDLPGLIQFTESEEDAIYIDLIRDLSLDYAKNENTIIVPVVSCRDDMENQGIIKLARDCDPQEKRTLLVMTKADLIEEGCEQKYIDILMGRSYNFNLGYYIVKGASKAQRVKYNPDHLMVRKWETEYFNTTEPWATKAPEVRNRLGVNLLSKDLSKLLVKKIGEQMPRMQAMVLERLEFVRQELKGMPETIHPDVMRHMLLDMIEEAQEDMQAKTMEQLWDNVKFNYNKFVSQIKTTGPRFDLLEPVVAKQAAKPEPDSEEDSEEYSTEDTSGDDVKKEKVEEKPQSIEDVKKAIMDVGSRQMRDVPYNAKKALITQYVRRWAGPSQTLVSVVKQLVQEELAPVMEKAFGRFFRLHDTARNIVAELLAEHEEGVRDMLDVLVEMEVRDPFTVRQSDMEYFNKQYLARLYRSFRQRTQRDYKVPQERMDMVLRKCKEMGLDGISEKQLLDLHEQNRVGKQHHQQDEEALEVMAAVLAYFDISYVRFTEDVCRTINKVMMDDFCKGMKTYMVKRLEVIEASDDKLIPYFVEDEELVKRRMELEQLQRKLLPVAREFGMR